MASQTYSPKLVIISFLGVNLTGFADGTFLTIAKNDDAMKLKVGADGESAVAISADESGKVTVTLLNTSPSNDFLSLQANLRARGPLQAKDLSGRMLSGTDDAWVSKVADVNKSKEIETTTWQFESGKLLIANNGNA